MSWSQLRSVLDGFGEIAGEEAPLLGALLHAHVPAHLLQDKTHPHISINSREGEGGGYEARVYLVLGIIVVNHLNDVAHLKTQLIHILLHVAKDGSHPTKDTGRQILDL